MGTEFRSSRSINIKPVFHDRWRQLQRSEESQIAEKLLDTCLKDDSLRFTFRNVMKNCAITYAAIIVR